MSNRPYFKSGIEELEALFESSKLNKTMLRSLQQELKHRAKPRAVALRGKVEQCLQSAQISAVSNPSPTPPERPRQIELPASSPRPERVAVECAHCSAANFVSAIEEVVQHLACSSCRTPFEAQFKYGIMRTKFLPVTQTSNNHLVYMALVIGAIALIVLLLK